MTVYNKLNNATLPDAQNVKLGTIIKGSPIVLKKAVTADATGEVSVTIPYAMEVYDVVVVCTAGSGGGTLTLKKGTTAITDAIACATDKAVARAGSLDDTVTTLAAGDAVSIDAAQAGDRGIMYIHGYRL